MTKPFCFSVRSAYYVEWNHQNGHILTRSDGQGSATTNHVWEILWSLQVPSKVKIILWKALHGIVPSMSNLANRHIPVSGKCPICSLDAEDIRHIMFSCPRAKEVWRSLGILHIIENALMIDRSGSVVLKELLWSNIKVQGNLAHSELKNWWLLHLGDRKSTRLNSSHPV